MPSYIQIDPCVPAVVPSPGSNGGISLDCVSTKTVTSTVDQTVEERYIDAESVQANQVSCTNLIVDEKYISNNVKNITADSSSTTINSDLNVTGKTSTQNLICLGDFYVAEDSEIQGNESIDGYLLVKGSGSQFQGSCYFANGIYYNSAPIYPMTMDYGSLHTGTGATKTWSIPDWATHIRVMLSTFSASGYVGLRFLTSSGDVGSYEGSTRGNNGDAYLSWSTATCMTLWNASFSGGGYTSYDLYKYNTQGTKWGASVTSNLVTSIEGYWTSGNGLVNLPDTAVSLRFLSTNTTTSLNSGTYSIHFS